MKPSIILKATLAAAIAFAPAAQAQTYVYRIPLQGVDAAPPEPGGEQGTPLSVGAYASPSVQAGQPLAIAAPSVSGGTAPYAFSGGAGLPSGTWLNADGTISGSPQSQGSYGATVTVQDSSTPPKTASATVSVTVAAPPQVGEVALSLNPAIPAEAMVGVPFPTVTASASGGQAPYAYARTGNLPGVDLAGSALAGTPTQAGTYTVGVTVTDSQAQPSSQGASGTVSVLAALAATPSAAWPTQAVRHQQIAPVTVAVSGGRAPYVYEHSGLPGGMSFGAGGLTGAPGAAGTYNVTLRVRESFANQEAMASFTLEVAQSVPVEIAYASPPAEAGTLNVAMPQFRVTPSGGSGAYTYDLPGAPAWLSIDAQGRVDGTPTATGTFTFAVEAIDAQNTSLRAQTPQITIVVTDPVSISTTLVERPLRESHYSFQMAAAGGDGGPYAWTQTGLPTTLTLSSSGLITGTPTAAGTYNVTFTAADSHNRQTSRILAVTVDNPATAASNSLLVQATTTANNGYVQLNGANLPTNAANLDQVIKASPSSYSFYGLTSSQSVTFRYSQSVTFSRFTSRIRALNGTVTLAVETSPDGSSWTQVHTINLASGMTGATPDSAAGGQMVTIDVALGTVTQGTYARIRRTNSGSWVGIGPGGFL